MKRYSPTERLGVIAIDQIVTRDLKWIFREQPLVDVGIDGIIEQVDNGNPLGKFLAVQIKTGKGNFYVKEKNLTLYVSNIHYNYWLNLNIPIILIAHLPEDNQTFWQEIAESKFKRSKKRWILEIPLNQGFTDKAEKKLSDIFTNKNDNRFDIYNGKINTDNIYDFAESVSCLREATDCIFNINDIITRLTEDTNKFNLKLADFVHQKLSNKDSAVIASFKSFGKTLNLTSRRLETETELFAQLYSEGMYAFQSILTILYNSGISLKNLNIDINQIYSIPDYIRDANSKFKNLKDLISTLPTEYPVMKESKNQFKEALEVLIFEFTEAMEITNSLVETTKSFKN